MEKILEKTEYKNMQKQEIRRQVVLGILSVIYAICLVFGHDIMLNYEDGVQYTSLSVWMRVVSWIVILFFALNIARIAVIRIWRGGGEITGIRMLLYYF